MSHQMTWSHYVELIKFEDANIINYYINLCSRQNLSVRELRDKIKNKEYERLDDNIKLKLIDNNDDNSINDFIKNLLL